MMIMFKFLTISICFMLSGCATVYPECKQHPKGSEALKACNTEVREYREGVDLINWELCMQTYKEADIITYHIDHTHSRAIDRVIGLKSYDVTSDLFTNHCRAALREYWADY